MTNPSQPPRGGGRESAPSSAGDQSRFTLAATDQQTSPAEADIVEVLRQVIDPELGCNIVDLGLVYSIHIADARAAVTMTLTTPGCPMHDSIRWGVQQALLGMAGVNDADVIIVWDPPWNPSMMTEFGRAATGVAIL